ncbi:MAG: glycosyltransferase family 1 protein [Bacteroidales bacterium]|nr:glycosyltransferase family 1 protein [Bacteroidales bacterium]MCM1146663.1 glycosyltransferase family 1 protein [Bacteroidales bacterium]MCM1206054.1 glycosyltransferase family 1 protein [Bacillota bacterium]MCM1511044.1 hypothetical protein [Clostridium sp.]
MRILLFGNPSTLHSNLAKGLKELGHEVRCISNRTGWHRFPAEDICLERRTDINGKAALAEYLLRMLPILRKCKGFDIVQLHHPMFLELRGTHMRPFYNYLRRHNRRMVLGAFGDDCHIVEQMLHSDAFRYSDQKIGDTVRTDMPALMQRMQWLGDLYHETDICRHVSRDCDHIVACLYEYWACYNNVYPGKLSFIPLPIVMEDTPQDFSAGEKVRLFIGIQKERSEVKGTDIMLRAAQAIVSDFPHLAELRIVENVPYGEYKRIMEGSDAILDQLYSYTPSMNSLLAMSKGIINIGGGEPESYGIIDEKELRPIINVQPSYDSVYAGLKDLVLHRDRIPVLKRQSVEYVRRHHDYLSVARTYESLYRKLLGERSENGKS